MKKLMKNKEKYLMVAVLLIVFLSIFILNNKTFYISDDFLYRFEFSSGLPFSERPPVDGLFSLIRSQYHHYSLWNGRFVSHSIIQFFMQFDKWIFNFVNTFVYLLLGGLILKVGSYVTRKKISIFVLVLVYIVLFLSIPNFGQTVLWISGTGNYLWMSIIYLGFYYFNLKLREDNWKTISISIIYGFLAGATNENTGPATILMVALLAIYQYFKEKEICIWRVSGIISSLVGFSMIIFAPAASKRVAERNEVSFIIHSKLENINSITSYIFENHLIYLIIIILLLSILYKNKRITERILINIIVLLSGYFGSTYSLIAVDKIIERTMFGPIIFLITITIILTIEVIDYYDNNIILIIGLLPFLLIFMLVYSKAFTDINNTSQEVEEQYEIILNNPGEDVKVPMISPPETDYNAYNNGTNYLKKDENAWLNIRAAKFFGVKSIGGK